MGCSNWFLPLCFWKTYQQLRNARNKMRKEMWFFWLFYLHFPHLYSSVNFYKVCGFRQDSFPSPSAMDFSLRCQVIPEGCWWNGVPSIRSSITVPQSPHQAHQASLWSILPKNPQESRNAQQVLIIYEARCQSHKTWDTIFVLAVSLKFNDAEDRQ